MFLSGVPDVEMGITTAITAVAGISFVALGAFATPLASILPVPSLALSWAKHYALWNTAFENSQWFSRAWTLPELIAQSSVEFFSSRSHLLGTKASYERQLHHITGIPLSVIRGFSLSGFSTEDRMSWAEGRRSEWVQDEDEVYCLLGIFEVQMPIVYSEGKKSAMRRLRSKIDNPSRGSSSELLHPCFSDMFCRY